MQALHPDLKITHPFCEVGMGNGLGYGYIRELLALRERARKRERDLARNKLADELFT